MDVLSTMANVARDIVTHGLLIGQHHLDSRPHRPRQLSDDDDFANDVTYYVLLALFVVIVVIVFLLYARQLRKYYRTRNDEEMARERESLVPEGYADLGGYGGAGFLIRKMYTTDRKEVDHLEVWEASGRTWTRLR